MKNTKPREVYYDVQINNFESTGIAEQPLRFSETRSKPLVDHSGSYSLSIVRFELDTYSLPTFIAEVVHGNNSDVNKMIESVTLEWDASGTKTTEGPSNLEWIPTNKHAAVPTAVQKLQEPAHEYYYSNSFRHYCDLVNNQFDSLTATLKTSVGAALVNLLPPKMIWNEQTQSAEIVAQQQFYDEDLSSHVNIFFNRQLYGRLSSFPTIANLNASLGRAYKIVIKSDYATKIVKLDIDGNGAVDYIKTCQEFSTISNWCAVASVVFTTNTLPIVSTQQSETMIYDNGAALNVGVPQNFVQVISDMSTNEMCYKPNLIYVPSAEYRMIDMFGDNSISTFDINVFWKDKRGHLVPFTLQSGASASIKILFRLKM
jgi:hypothetical protein